jgi:predicted metal-dependent HD superfamily phosphohydrolase
MKGYIKLKKEVLGILNTKLPKDLYYHGIHHTIDALDVCEIYLIEEKINEEDVDLLRIGVLMHDIGFTVSIENHEVRGVEMAEKLMSKHNFSPNEIEVVKELILATRVPQNPKTHLEKIICDVDLDYLGRSDYYTISDQLYEELFAYNNIESKTEWNKVQIKFLERHKYHTDFAKKNRQPQKEMRIEELKELVRNKEF